MTKYHYALAGLAWIGCATPTASLEQGILTTDDTDVAAECAGILEYANTAPQPALEAFLPVATASAVVARRTQAPFVSIADLSSVSGIAQGRLEQITSAARGADFIDADCAGVYDELAVSADDRGAILAFVNTASSERLTAALRFRPDTVAPALIAARPFTTLEALAGANGVGPATFRALRDAAIDGPFDELVNAVNALHRDVTIVTDFDPYRSLFEGSGHLTSMTCFGLDPDFVAEYGGVDRPNLADGAEVVQSVRGHVGWANRFHQLTIDPEIGLADLAAQTAGGTFQGCYTSFAPDPWSGVNRAFFVNIDTGYRVLSETRWSE